MACPKCGAENTIQIVEGEKYDLCGRVTGGIVAMTLGGWLMFIPVLGLSLVICGIMVMAGFGNKIKKVVCSNCSYTSEV